MTGRYKDISWDLGAPPIATWERVVVAVLMDIRDEMKRLNAAIYCANFQAIPTTLQTIRNNTAKKKKRRKA